MTRSTGAGQPSSQRPAQTPMQRPGQAAVPASTGVGATLKAVASTLLHPDPKATRIAILLQDLEAANQHIDHLRAKLPTTVRGSQTIERAIKDAYAILVEAFNTGQTGRDHMLAKVGMKRSAWQWAVAFLRCAGVVAQRSPNVQYDWQTGLQFSVQDRDVAFARHKQAAMEIEVKEDGYQVLRRMWVYGFLPHESTDVNSKRFVQAKGEGNPSNPGRTRAQGNVQGNAPGNAVGNVRVEQRGAGGQRSGQRSGQSTGQRRG